MVSLAELTRYLDTYLRVGEVPDYPNAHNGLQVENSGTIGRIAEIASAIAAAVQEQQAATQEISRNVQQASHGADQVATDIAAVSRGAGETEGASGRVLDSAEALAQESARLRKEVDNFLATVRVA